MQFYVSRITYPLLIHFLCKFLSRHFHFLFCSPGEEEAPGTRKLGLGGLSLRGRLITGLWISVSYLHGEGLRPGIPCNPSWLAELTSYVPVQMGNTGQASLAVPSYSSSGIWHYSGNRLLWHSARLNAPTLNFCNWEALKCICRPWLLRLLIIVVVIDF